MSLKYIKEYRDSGFATNIIEAIKSESRQNLSLMEVCGTHTMSIFQHGIRSVLPPFIALLSGPGCPVCVTVQKDINAFVQFSKLENMVATTFENLMKVPGSGSSLAQEKAAGTDVRIVYSMFDAIQIAKINPDKQIIFCDVGFETTIPTIAAGILSAEKMGIINFSIYSANKLTPPALAAYYRYN